MHHPTTSSACACAPASALGAGAAGLPAAVVAARREWALARCEAARLLLSGPRRAVLDFLCARATPIAV